MSKPKGKSTDDLAYHPEKKRLWAKSACQNYIEHVNAQLDSLPPSEELRRNLEGFDCTKATQDDITEIGNSLEDHKARVGFGKVGGIQRTKPISGKVARCKAAQLLFIGKRSNPQKWESFHEGTHVKRHCQPCDKEHTTDDPFCLEARPQDEKEIMQQYARMKSWVEKIDDQITTDFLVPSPLSYQWQILKE